MERQNLCFPFKSFLKLIPSSSKLKIWEYECGFQWIIRVLQFVLPSFAICQMCWQILRNSSEKSCCYSWLKCKNFRRFREPFVKHLLFQVYGSITNQQGRSFVIASDVDCTICRAVTAVHLQDKIYFTGNHKSQESRFDSYWENFIGTVFSILSRLAYREIHSIVCILEKYWDVYHNILSLY